MVLRGLKQIAPDDAERWLDGFLQAAGVKIAPVTEDQTAVARRAHIRFGKGGGHPARLNFGDCFAYALAQVLGAPLPFRGGDFGRTDVTAAI